MGFKEAPNINFLKANVTRKHKEILLSEKEKKCWICFKVFPRSYSLKRHMVLIHSDKNKENSGIVKSTTSCDKISITNTLFKKKPSNGIKNFT